MAGHFRYRVARQADSDDWFNWSTAPSAWTKTRETTPNPWLTSRGTTTYNKFNQQWQAWLQWSSAWQEWKSAWNTWSWNEWNDRQQWLQWYNNGGENTVDPGVTVGIVIAVLVGMIIIVVPTVCICRAKHRTSQRQTEASRNAYYQGDSEESPEHMTYTHRGGEGVETYRPSNDYGENTTPERVGHRMHDRGGHRVHDSGPPPEPEMTAVTPSAPPAPMGMFLVDPSRHPGGPIRPAGTLPLPAEPLPRPPETLPPPPYIEAIDTDVYVRPPSDADSLAVGDPEEDDLPPYDPSMEFSFEPSSDTSRSAIVLTDTAGDVTAATNQQPSGYPQPPAREYTTEKDRSPDNIIDSHRETPSTYPTPPSYGEYVSIPVRPDRSDPEASQEQHPSLTYGTGINPPDNLVEHPSNPLPVVQPSDSDPRGVVLTPDEPSSDLNRNNALTDADESWV